MKLMIVSYFKQMQVKAAYRKKVWETHPDCFPVHLKPNAELKFKMVSFPLCRHKKCLLSSFLLMIPAAAFRWNFIFINLPWSLGYAKPS